MVLKPGTSEVPSEDYSTVTETIFIQVIISAVVPI